MSDAVCAAPVFVVIGDFATRLAANVSKWITELGYEAKLLDAAMKWGKDIPLVVCESRQMLKRMGVLCPYEFIVKRSDLIPAIDNKGNAISNPVDVLKCRLSTLAVRYQKGVDEDAMRDWFSGLFRRYMCLDETVHGTSNLIDLENLETDKLLSAVCDKKTDNLDARKFRARFLSAVEENPPADSLRDLQGLLRVLFADEKKDVEEAIASKEALIDVFKRCRDSYDPSREDSEKVGVRPAFPRPLGNRAKYATPTGKIDVLVVDDTPRKITDIVDNAPDDGRIQSKSLKLCGDLFNFQPLQINARSGNVFERAAKAFGEIRKKGLTFDLALVDLCLADAAGGDLTGYRMIRFVRLFFPSVPVVVYSRYRDMDHIVRAFKCGARWFLIKGEEDKLPRHVLRMLKQSGWHREWESVQRNFKPVFLPRDDHDEFMRKFRQTPEWQYLTYKSLEFYPGSFITIKKMGGGISSAVTFKAIKGIKLDGEFLQSPSIIKIDSAYNTMMEFERYYRFVRPYIANEVGRVEMPERILNRDTASIVYTFAGHPDATHKLDSMATLLRDAVRYESSCDYERFRKAMDLVFDEILPRIHKVTPAREFGDGVKNDCYAGIVEPQMTGRSAFPNANFGECEVGEFYKSYLERMQPWREIKLSDDAEFVHQPKYDEKIENPLEIAEGCQQFVFHAAFQKNGRYVIEAYDQTRRLVWLSGLPADHVARFRRLVVPGKTLWIKAPSDDGDCRLRWLLTSIGDDPTFVEAITRFVSDFVPNAEDGVKGCLCEVLRLQDDLLDIAHEVGSVLKDAGQYGEMRRVFGCEFRSPVGIVHGDLNYGNIMLESRRQDPQEQRPDERWRLTDAWLIDFARTRRDIIAHDFNVAFTSTLLLLFDAGKVECKTYAAMLASCFESLVRHSFVDESKCLIDVPNDIAKSSRLSLIYRMVRRIRFAALAAGVSPHMYLLTSALACAYTFKIFLNRRSYLEAAALVAVMKICHDLLLDDMQDEDFKARMRNRMMSGGGQ